MRRTACRAVRACAFVLVAPGFAGCASFLPAFPAGTGGALATQFRDGPPARVTGGFGEDSCSACHYEPDAQAPDGGVKLLGLPQRYAPGETYLLELVLTLPGMQAAGFQLAFRHFEDMSQAGVVAVPESERRRVGLMHERDVQFAHQLIDSSEVAESGAARWTVLWTAPESGERVVVHAAAVAADGDESQLGDHVYTLEATADPVSEAR
jgi:hypothetical protein